MSYRFMRMMIFFDLPTDTIKDRREYAHFRKYLIKSGFVMMQESVYCKLLMNSTAQNAMAEIIRRGGFGLLREKALVPADITDHTIFSLVSP